MKKMIIIFVLVIFSNLFARQLPTESTDQWFKVMLNDQKAGYIHHKSETSPQSVKSYEFVKLNLGRAGAKITATVSEGTEFQWDTRGERYRLNAFNSSMEIGPAIVKVKGEFSETGKYNIRQSIGGNVNNLEMVLSDKIQPVELLIHNAIKDGIVPGTTVSGTAFSPSDMSEVDFKVVIGQKEKVAGFTLALHKCTTIMTVRGTPIETVSYIDSEGKDVISTIEMMGLKFQFIAAEMEEALANEGVAEVLADVAIKAPANSPDPTKAKAVRYHLKFDKTNIDFYHDSHQVITNKKAGSSILEIKPSQPKVSQQLPPDCFSIEPQLAFKKSTDIIQTSMTKAVQAQNCFDSDNLWLKYNDPAIRKLAQTAIGDERDAWKAALKIESFVNDYINEKNLSTGWASAVDIVKTRSGDCSEHAVLTAAVCLASGIPARVAIGYFYVEDFATVKKSFYGHAWTQVWINDSWYTIDATRPHQSQCPAYITSAVTDGNPLNAYKITQSFFKIDKIEVIAP